MTTATTTCRQPNIILITTDQQRYDTLGATGNPHLRTPAIDALASRGLLFDRAYIQNPVCVPSRACIQTGRYVHQHGVEFMRSEIDQTPGLPPWEPTMMERLQQVGYATAAFGKIHMMPPRGFDTMQLTMGKGARWTSATDSPYGPAQLGPVYEEWLERQDPGAYERLYRERRRPEYGTHATAVPFPLPAEQYVDSWIGQNAVDHIAGEDDSKPSFTWVGFCGPHTPFDPPEPYASRYDQDSIPLPELFGAVSPSPLVGGRRPQFDGRDGAANVRRVIAYYWAMMALIDDMVARIVSAVENAPSDRETMIIMTTDHGELLGDFGSLGKANFTESVIRAPLIIVPSLRGAVSGGRRIDDLVEHVDLTATVLDAAGIAAPEEMAGRSLRGLWDDDTAWSPRDGVLCEYTSNDRRDRSKCLRTAHHKYVFHDGGRPSEFYDLAEDPHELTNLASDPSRAGRVRDHAELLLDRLSTGAANPWSIVPAARAPEDVDDFGQRRVIN